MVAPFTGAWIEIAVAWRMSYEILSHPSRVRGLKLGYLKTISRLVPCRTLHGCVD